MGKQISPQNVIGRDKLIAQIWAHIQKTGNRGSLRFTAERRIGKTTIMQKMAAEPHSGVDVLFLEVEGIDSCKALTEMIVNRARPLLSKFDNATSTFFGFCKDLGGVEIAGVVKLPEINGLAWQPSLDKIIEKLCRACEERLVLLMFDELPYMLQKINQVSTQPHEALTLLDTLRAMRQRHQNLRMIFAGSVGLHHVLHDLRDIKLPAEPVNNMQLIEIEPLTEEHAYSYGKKLLEEGEINVDANSVDAVIHSLIARANYVPFYMEQIANQLALFERAITRDDVEATVKKQLTSDQDPWEMEHFRERLSIYYAGELATASGVVSRAAVARYILDHLAVTNQPMSIEQIWQAMRGQLELTDRQVIVDLLKSLGQDHYLACDTNKLYTFRFELIRSWWMSAQGLNQ